MSSITRHRGVSTLSFGWSRRDKDEELKKFFVDVLGRHPDARIKVVFWDGSEVVFGERQEFTIRFKNSDALRDVLSNASLGFGEGYMNGDIEVDGDLREVAKFGYSSETVMAGSLWSRLKAVWLTFAQGKTKAHDRKHISHHYDLGNDFYSRWLDKEMTYSCGYFLDEGDSIDEAQQNKMAYCCRKLRLQPGESLLDIGCGWGGQLIMAARQYGVEGLGITLSRRQVEHAWRRVQEEGLGDNIAIEYLDYRDLPRLGRSFDKIVSVGMFEHVGKGNIQEFFASVRHVLNPGGLFLFHTIGKVEPMSTDPWLKKYIFPGSYLPNLGEILKAASRAGLNFMDLEDLRPHYGRTLDRWLERFEAHCEPITEKFGERFVRMWRLYLAASSASFWAGKNHVFQILFSAGTLNTLPLTRNWMTI